MRSRILFTIALASLLLLTALPATHADILTGAITHQPESVGVFTWGDGVNELFQQWSVMNINSAGWFYGLNYPWSNCDVYVYAGLSDPTVVTDASVFPYTSGSQYAYEGSTVFFRGSTGYYGAWSILDIYPGEPGEPALAYLDGIWYFVTDQSADFSQGTVATEQKTLSGVRSLFE